MEAVSMNDPVPALMDLTDSFGWKGHESNAPPLDVKLTPGGGCRRQVDGAQENRQEDLIHLGKAENKFLSNY